MDSSAISSLGFETLAHFVAKPQPLLQPAPFQVSDAVHMRLHAYAPPAEYPDTVTSSR